MAWFYFYPKKAQSILIPELEQVRALKIKVVEDTALVDIELELQNHGPFKMNIDSLIYNLKFDTATLLSGAQDLNVILKAGDSGIYTLPARLPYKRLFKSIREAQDFDSVPILSDIRIVYSTVFGTRSVPHQTTTTIAVPCPPRFELEKIEYVRQEKKSLYFDAYLTMHNCGKIKLDLSDLTYTMKVEDLFDANGSYDEVIRVKSETDITRVLPIKVDVNKIWKTIFKIISNRDMVSYQLKIKGKIMAEKFGDQPSEIEISKNGKLELKK
jgi:LEA14-like dessication related protein